MSAPGLGATPETRYARSGSVRIAYQVVGSGPLDLVLVPGFISNLDLFWEEPELKRQHEAWGASRSQFNTDLRQPGSAAQAERWQKMYHRGVTPDGAEGAGDHRTRLKLRPFVRS